MIQLLNKCIQCIGSMLMLTPFCGLALEGDALQSYHITSDTAVYNQNEHTTIFIGNVIATKGSSTLTGAKMILNLDKTNKKIVKLVSFGKPATYTTQPKKESVRLYAKADIINYYPNRAFAILVNNVKITRGGNSITGNYLTYDMNKEIVESNTHKKNSRTTIILQPEDTH